ncbi:MAG: hypothetical protein RLZ35_1013 [Pseudomonadota bacterium]|jgi:thiol:disulfide interchange protein DsbA
MKNDCQDPNTKVNRNHIQTPCLRILIKTLLLFFVSTCYSLSFASTRISNYHFLDPQWSDKKLSRPPLAIAKAKQVPYATEEETGPSEEIDFIEGKHYKKIPFEILKNPFIQQFILKDPGKIQVIEFFNYGCFWCSRLSRPMNEWETQKPNSVVYYRYPLVFNKNWEILAKVFYTLKKLGKTEALDQEIFDAIHQNHINLADIQELVPFVESHGISGEKFMQIYNSNGIMRQVKQGNDLSLSYRIAESPVVVINTSSGSFLCSVPDVGSESRFIQLLNHLIRLPVEKEAV